MNSIRALLTTGLVSVVLAVSGYFVYDNSDLLFGEADKPELVMPAAEVVEVTEPVSAAASSSETSTAPAPALEPEPASTLAPVSKASVSKAPVSLATAPEPRPMVAKTEPTSSGEASKPVTAPAPSAKEIQLIIKDIKFTGVTLVPEKELKQAVSEFIGTALTVDQAFAIPAQITSYYKRNNHMAIANLSGAMTPDGVLTVGVVEMQMTQTQAEKELATLAPQPTPKITNVPNVVPLQTPSPTVTAQPQPQAQAQLQEKSVSAGNDVDSETDYILKNYAKKSRQYELMVDNYGHDATGSTRVGAALSIGGDQLSLVGFKSSGADYLRMAVNWVTGIDGLKVGAHVSTLKFDVVNHLQSAMYQSGDALKRGVSLVYELVNEASQYSTLALKFDSKSSNAVGLNLANSTAYQSWVSNLEYKGIVREMIPGGAVFTYELAYAQGHVDINGASNIGGIEVDEGPFSKLRFTGTITQPLDGLGSVFAGLSVQRSKNNLDPSERFFLGGPNGVRAYGVGEGYGSEGELATLELRQRLSATTTISEFYDWGRARLSHNLSAANNTTTLSGYGVSVTQEVGKNTTIKGTWARSHGNNTPLPTSPNGSDNADRNRFWLSMETRF
ncbi:MAG: hypothetical protein RL295_1777 [Pseudomonadota bacterium]